MLVSKVFMISGIVGSTGMAICTAPELISKIEIDQINKRANAIVNKFWALNESLSKMSIGISKSITNIC